MGARKVLRAALEDLLTLPEGAAKASRLTDPDEKAIVMNATALYEQIKDKGREEGREQALRDLLFRQLTRRFGELPRAVVERIDAADSAKLDRWDERFVTAATLDEVFGRKR